jgi:hypothetical protein
MSSLPIARTVHALAEDTSLTDFRAPSNAGASLSTRLGAWIVALTERAQHQLARSAIADARDGGLSFQGQTRFLGDAAGGGSRRTEAARSLAAPELRG